jgi:hypothetical protein
VLALFRCQAQLGIIQYACIPDPAGTNITLTLVFKVSLVSGAKQIGCAANQELQITSAEVGSGRAIKVMSLSYDHLERCLYTHQSPSSAATALQ